MGVLRKSKELAGEIRERTIGYLTASFGLIAGLAWNDAIKAGIEALFPLGGSHSVIAKFIYAVLITTAVVSISVYLLKFLEREKTEEQTAH